MIDKSNAIDESRKVANDTRAHVGDRLEALCDLYDLYDSSDDPIYHRRKSEVIDSIRELVRTEI